MAWQQINGIPFSKKDSTELSKAVKRYNSKLKRIMKKYENEDIMLPDLLSTRELKTNIMDKRDLKNQLKSIERFMQRGSEEIVTLDSGIKMTKYQRNELKIGIIRGKAILRSRINELDKRYPESDNPTVSFRNYMLRNDEKTNLERQIKSLKNVDKRDKQSLERLKQRIETYSSHTKMYKKNLTYKENYIDVIKKLFQYHPEIEQFSKFLDFIDPMDFYAKISHSDTLSDIKFIYQQAEKIGKGLVDDTIDEFFNEITDAWGYIYNEKYKRQNKIYSRL